MNNSYHDYSSQRYPKKQFSLTCDNRLSLHSVKFLLPESFTNSFFRAVDLYFNRINHYRVLRTERSSWNRKTTLNKSYFNPLAPMDKDLIRTLELAPHVEGGCFRQTKKASDTINLAGKGRALYTSIYFLLEETNPSHFHRLTADEIWYFHAGSQLTVHMITADGHYETVTLGLDISKGNNFTTVFLRALFGDQQLIRIMLWFLVLLLLVLNLRILNYLKE